MGSKKLGRLLLASVCLTLFVGILNCYGAKKTAEDYFKIGREFSGVNNSDHAIYNYSQAIKLNPNMAKAYNNRGVAYMGRQQYDLAIADFTKAIKLNPKNGKAYNNRAIAYWYKGDTKKAREDVTKAQSLGISVNKEFLEKIKEQPANPR